MAGCGSRYAGDSPKDNSECMSGAVSVLYPFFFRATPFLGENAVGEKKKKKKKKKKKIYIYIYTVYIQVKSFSNI